MENTWNPPLVIDGSINSGNDHSLGPTRRKMVLEEEKIQYHILKSVVVEGIARQTYLHSGIDGDLDTILELFWTKVNKTMTLEQ